jgi:integrase/recombinase XerD
MTELRKRMIESLQLRGLSERTQESYIRAVRQLAEHFHKSPDLISEEELRQYFLYIKNVKKWSRPTTTIALCGIKFFFDYTLNKPFTTLSGAPGPGEEASPHPQPRRSPRHSLLHPSTTLPRLSFNHLLVWTATPRGDSSSSS